MKLPVLQQLNFEWVDIANLSKHPFGININDIIHGKIFNKIEIFKR
jgi:hypothetical protein